MKRSRRSNTDDSSDDEVTENKVYEETLFNNNHTRRSLLYKLKPKRIVFFRIKVTLKPFILKNEFFSIF